MEFRAVTPADYEAVRELLACHGWGRRVADPEAFTKMMKHTDRAVVAMSGSGIIGFARALCDEVSNGYISMVVVAEEHRGQGLGRKLVAQLMGDDPSITWVLRADRDSQRFWESLGFQNSSIAMERLRR